MRYIYYAVLILISIALLSCSSAKNYYDDGVRIKDEKHNKPDYKYIKGTEIERNPATLRGEVIGVETRYEGCGSDDPEATEKSYVLFKDSTDNSPIERIPIEDVILIGLNEKVNLDTNFFENFNDPLDPRAIREVDHRYTYLDTCDTSEPCDCQPISIGLKCPTAHQCRDTVVRKRWYFIEAKGGYAIYNDREPGAITDVAREAYFGEIATGFRFGSRNQYGLGLLFSSGVPLYNSLDIPDPIQGEIPKSIYRPLVMLHGRYQTESIFCVRPFFYGNFGIAIDDLSLDYNCFTLQDCEECKDQLAVALPDADFDLPSFSYGLGAGIDIPVTCQFDISLDIGWRSVAFGELSPYTLFGSLVPTKRRVNMFIFRLGVTI